MITSQITRSSFSPSHLLRGRYLWLGALSCVLVLLNIFASTVYGQSCYNATSYGACSSIPSGWYCDGSCDTVGSTMCGEPYQCASDCTSLSCDYSTPGKCKYYATTGYATQPGTGDTSACQVGAYTDTTDTTNYRNRQCTNADTANCSELKCGTTIFTENFESFSNATNTTSGSTLYSTGSYTVVYTKTGNGRARYGTSAIQKNGGTKALTLDQSSTSTTDTNFVVFTINLSAYTSSNFLTLGFDYSHHGEESHTGDRVWIRGTNTGNWIQAYDLYANRASAGTYKRVEDIDVDALLTSTGQQVSSTFQIRLGQHDNGSATSTTASDGMSFDNITLGSAATTTYYADSDGDGYGTGASMTGACSLPAGYVTNTGDCNDTNALQNPTSKRYLDGDSDKYASGTTAQTGCIDPGATWYLPSQLSGTCVATQYTAFGCVGCNPYNGDTSQSTSLPLLCYKQDSAVIAPSGMVSFGSGRIAATAAVVGSTITSKVYADNLCVTNFGTGWIWASYHTVPSVGTYREFYSGSLAAGQKYRLYIDDQPNARPWAAGSTILTFQRTSIITGATSCDCNDMSGSIAPLQADMCNGVDNDCDGVIDEGTTWYTDADTDGFSTGSTQNSCTDPGATAYLPNELFTNVNTQYSLGLTNGLLRHRTFDRDDGRDSSGNGGTGTFPNGGVFTGGKHGRAMLFDNTFRYMSGNTTGITHGTGAFTYTWWTKWNATPGTYQTYFENNLYTNGLLVRQASSSTIDIYSMNTDYGTFSFTPTVGAWTHLSLVRTGNTLHLYVNGTQIGTGKSFSPNISSTSRIYLGSSQHTSYQTLNAAMDDFRIYNRALTTGEVVSLISFTNLSGTGDCADTTGARSPFATEVCDGQDNDCDGSVDEGFATGTYYLDADSDGYGTSSTTTIACSLPGGYVTNTGDCNDTSNVVYSGAIEICDSLDNDCDGSTDEGVEQGTYYLDADGDGFSTGATQTSCTDPGATWYLPSELIGSSASVAGVTSGLIGHWGFDADDGRDSSGNGYTGNVLNGVIFTGGKIGRASWFDNSDDKIQTSTGMLAGTANFTMSAWIKRTQTGATIADYIMGNYGTSTCGGGVAMYVYNNELRLSIGSVLTGTSVLSTISDRYHVAITRSSGSIALYVNGVLNKTGTNSTSISSTCNWSIGNGPNYTTEAFGGTIDDARVYNRALTGSEIMNLYTLTNIYATGDCADTTGARSPIMPELCNGIDDDCDGATDEGLQTTYYIDTDGDGYSSGSSQTSCTDPGALWYTSSQLSGTVGDCNDANNLLHPNTIWYKDTDGDLYSDGTTIVQCADPGVTYDLAGALSGTNNDCDDADAREHPGQLWYKDADADDHGDSSTGAMTQCLRPTDHYLDGELTDTNDDCDDADANNYVGNTETCESGDNDCDGLVDEADPGFTGGSAYFRDGDSDGYGNAASGAVTCTMQTGYVANSTDCDDTDILEFPGQEWYLDADADDYGDANASLQVSCTRPANRYVASELTATATDCVDTNIEINPTTNRYLDADTDRYGTGGFVTQCADPGAIHFLSSQLGATAGDCAPTDARLHPATIWYLDADADGFSTGATQTACTDPGATWYLPGQMIGSTHTLTSLDDNIVGYRSFDRHDGRDISTSLNTGSLQGVPTFTGGTLGAAVRLDGTDDYMTMAPITLTGDYTVSFITKYLGTSVDAVGPMFLGGGDQTNGADYRGYIWYRPSTNQWRIAQYAENTVVIADSAATLENGASHQVMIQRAGTTLSVYIDGTFIGSGAYATVNDMTFRSVGRSYSNYFVNGTMDDVRIYDRALTPTELSQLYKSTIQYGTSDCVDSNIEINPRTIRYADTDGDGHSDGSSQTQCADPGATRYLPSQLTSTTADCNDGNATIYSGASEICDLLDNDCDSTIDEGVQTTYYRDADSDTYGTVSVTTGACSVPTGYVTNTLDCNDSANTIYSGAVEFTGDNIDQSCDGQELCYVDADDDTYRLSTTVLSTDTDCTDSGEAVSGDATGECNDANAAINPAATEVCDGVDNDCDSQIDEGVTVTYYRDADSDTYGTPSTTTGGAGICVPPSGWVLNTLDCNDAVNTIYSGAVELTGDQVDQSCDGQELCYADADEDGYRSAATVLSTDIDCTDSGEAIPADLTGECNDANAAINPAATEVCDAVDNDCDGTADNGILLGTYYIDTDNDGRGNPSVSTGGVGICTTPAGYSTVAGDCNDAVNTIYSGAAETTGDNIDQGCDGRELCYIDADDDTYRLSTTMLSTDTDCTDSGEAIPSDPTGECNDANGAINPAATEICDGIDNDCDSNIDENVTVTYYRDADGDTYGTPSTTTGGAGICTPPSGWVAGTGDCDDSANTVYSGAVEFTGDNIDQSCDGRELCYVDTDNDTYTIMTTTLSTDADCNDTTEGLASDGTGDCNDASSSIHPGAAEICNTTDEDCDAITTDITQVPLTECQALLDIYDTMSGAGWTNTSGWKTASDLNNWYGVTVVGGRIEALGLSNNNLFSTLPASFAYLTGLHTALLDHNSITGLGTGITTLSALETLNIGHNSFTSLPSSIGGMTGLQALYAENNSFTSLPSQIGNLTALTLLALDDNDLSSLPNEIGNLSNLDVLTLSNNSLTAVPTQISQLTGLVQLDLSHNNLTSLPANMLNTRSQLSDLDMSYNQLTGISSSLSALVNLITLNLEHNLLETVPSTLGDMASLTTLDLSDNALTSLPNVLDGLVDLLSLDISTNALTVLPSSLNQVTTLTDLRANNNQLTTGLSLITTLIDLVTLYLQDNDLTGLIPTNFANLTDLTTMYLQNNNLDRTNTHAAITSHLSSSRYNRGGFTKNVANQGDVTAPVINGTGGVSSIVILFHELDLDRSENSYAVSTGNELMSLVFSGPGLCPYLTATLTETGSTDSETITITSATGGNYSGCTLQLEDHAGNLSNSISFTPFFLSNNYIDICTHTEMTVPVAECQAIVQLYIDTDGANWTNKTGWFRSANVDNRWGIHTIATGGDGKQHVDGVYLHKSTGTSDAHGATTTWNGNNLIGVLPESFTNLPYLRDLNLSNNSLSGPLPASITDLTNLERWYMKNNQISGVIPTDIASLNKLIQFDLSANQLGGTIPSGLGTIMTLQGFDLGANALVGNIPASLGDLSVLDYLGLANNQLTGSIPINLGNATALNYLYLQGNDLMGTIPSSFIRLTQISGPGGPGIYQSAFNISDNNLDRDNSFRAIIPASLGTWYATIPSANKIIENQGDIIAPTISGNLSGLPLLFLGTGSVTISVNENSFPVSSITNGSLGMPIVFSGLDVCNTLTATRVTTNTGTVNITITATTAGIYENCTMGLRDHASLTSNMLALPTFFYNAGAIQTCYAPGLTIPRTECLALHEFYTMTNGTGWTNKNNWWNTGNVDTWFGVNTAVVGTQAHVTEILLHRNDLTNSADASANGTTGNHLTGSLLFDFGRLPYLTKLRLDHNNLGSLLSNMAFGSAPLTAITLSHNNFTGTISAFASGITTLTHLDLSDNTLRGSLPSTWQGYGSIQTLDLSHNLLGGTIPSTISGLSAIQSLDLSYNQLIGTPPSSIGSMSALHTLYLQNNLFTGELSSSRSGLTALVDLDLSHNALTGSLPASRGILDALDTLDLSHNQLGGRLTLTDTSWTGLVVLDLSYNAFRGAVPTGWVDFGLLDELFINNNNFNRTIAHDAIIPASLGARYAGVGTKTIANQGDIIAPTLSSTSIILSPVINQQITYLLNVSESSYYINTAGSGMTIIATGGANCDGIYLSTGEIRTGGVTTIQLLPTNDGLHTCQLAVRDHGGNRGYHDLTPFIFDMSCGNGIPDTNEECDEGRQCDDGTDCTDDSSLCPTECRPRFTDGCNPSCEPTSCGDGYIDALGADNTDGTTDDEVCDPGRICNITNKDCTIDPDLCGPGDGVCVVLENDGCSPTCFPTGCGDGTLDLNGVDNVLGNSDDEQCDDNNVTSTDGCSATCQDEYCGDGIVSVGLGEQCDLGASNGAVGGVCDSSCQIPTSQQCRELCEDNGNGTGKNTIFLLIDRSGSTQGQNRLTNIKTAANSFVDVLTGMQYSGATWTRGSRAGVISFANTVSLDLAPTDNFGTVHTTIDAVNAGANSNIAGAINSARARFTGHVGTEQKVIVLISDGTPTQPGGSNNAKNAAKAAADAAKAEGVVIFTIGLQISNNGRDLLQYLASSSQHYLEDQSNEILVEIYQSIFGSIHCSCEPFEEIEIKCGNAQVDVYSGSLSIHNEECDSGSFCNDRNGTTGTSCTTTGSVCAGGAINCRPRQTSTCTPTCHTPFCGDGVLDTNGQDNSSGNSDDEECDDGNGVYGDGCSDTCKIEDCGDGEIQTSLGEQCDDGNADDFDGCSNTCLLRGCGDAYLDTDGPDDNPATSDDNELCDEGRYCDDRNGTTGTSCVADPFICPGECQPRFRNGCSPSCDFGTCGDQYVDTNGINNIASDSDDETCDGGSYCPNGLPCNHNPGLCLGQCAPTRTPACTESCVVTHCGDGYVDLDGLDDDLDTLSDNEECDDGNESDGDLCSSTCQEEVVLQFCPAGYECPLGYTQHLVVGEGYYCYKEEFTGATVQ